MANSSYANLANSLADTNWTTDTNFADWGNGSGGLTATREEMQLAAIIDIMRSLRAIKAVLTCPNVLRMAMSTQSIDLMLKNHLKKKPKPKKKTARAS